MNENSIRVISGDKWIKSSANLFWGTNHPCEKDYIKGVRKQISMDGFNRVQLAKFDGWTLIASEDDWITVGLNSIESDDELDLFKSIKRFSDKDGNIGVRIEYPLKVFTEKLTLWRRGKFFVIKGKEHRKLLTFIRNKFQGATVLAFNNNDVNTVS